MFNPIANLVPKRDNSNYEAVTADFEARRRKAQEEHEARLAKLEAEEAAARDAAFDADREGDPAWQESQRLLRKQSEAQQRAAERAAVLLRVLDAERKRKAPSRAEVAAASASLYASGPSAVGDLLKLE